jgi:hypothetical protein
LPFAFFSLGSAYTEKMSLCVNIGAMAAVDLHYQELQITGVCVSFSSAWISAGIYSSRILV